MPFSPMETAFLYVYALPGIYIACKLAFPAQASNLG